MVKSVLIIGGSGFLGTQLALKLRDGYKVFATYNRHPVQIPGTTCIPFNVDNVDRVKRQLYMASPDVVIYAAGSNDVAWAEENARDAEKTHAGGPMGLLKVVNVFQPRFIYLSNCYTFDGERGNYHEVDSLTTSTTLGKLKASAETAIRGRAVNYTILRSSPLLGRGNGRNLSLLDHWRIKLAKGQRIELHKTELHSFGLVSRFTEAVAKIIEGGPRNKVFHFGGLTKCTYPQLAKAFAKRFGFDPSLILEKETELQHPFDYSLNSTELVKTLKVEPLLLEESLDLIEKELVASL